MQEGSVGPGREEGVIVTLGFSVDEPDRPADLKKRASGSGRTAYGDGSDAAGTKLGLKAVDVAVPLLDIQRFVDAGRLQHDSGGSPLLSSSWTGDARTRRRLAGGRAEEGWGWLHADAASHRTAGNVDHPAPFIAALARYLSHHLALDLFHPSVRITKIASAGFTLAEGGRVRIAEPPTPVGEGRHADGGLVEGGTHHQAVWDLLAGLSTRATGRLVA